MLIDFGAVIYAQRKKLGMDIEEVANKAGVSKFTVRNIESGFNQNPQISTLEAVLNTVGLELRVEATHANG